MKSFITISLAKTHWPPEFLSTVVLPDNLDKSLRGHMRASKLRIKKSDKIREADEFLETTFSIKPYQSCLKLFHDGFLLRQHRKGIAKRALG